MKVIAIDGPAGAGKSTVARRLAEHLGLAYLDTGAMYRGVTVAVLAHGVAPSDSGAVAALVPAIRIEIGSEQITVDGTDATEAIRTAEITRAVSSVAANPAVRSALVARQRDWVADHGGGVVEGRDIGTVVFPDATLKLYITARPEVRAQRRAHQNHDRNLDGVAADMVRRDTADSQRAASPLSVADDAQTIDTSGVGVDEIVDGIVEMLT